MENSETTSAPLSGELGSELAPKIEEALQNLSRLNERALVFARERPGVCLVGALALGFVVGKIAARY